MKIDASTITGTSIVVTVDGRTFVFGRRGPESKTVLRALKEGDGDAILALKHVNLPTEISDEEVKIVDDELFFMGKPMHGVLVDRIIELNVEGLDVKPYCRFLSNLRRNPNQHSIEQLYGFIEACGLSITEDGCFLAYKSVRNDYSDKYTGTIKNVPGAVVSMNRAEVSTDPANACAPGLHVGAWSYAGEGGWYNKPNERVMLVKVNPRHVCRVPDDHANQKCAVCEYVVVREIEKSEPPTVLPKSQEKSREREPEWSGWSLAHDGDGWVGDSDLIYYLGQDEQYNAQVVDGLKVLEMRLVYEKKDGTVHLYTGRNPAISDDERYTFLDTPNGVRQFSNSRIQQAMVRHLTDEAYFDDDDSYWDELDDDYDDLGL